MDVSEIIKELNRLISEKYKDFKGSYLYGSRAKGTHKEDSDIDVVALFEETNYEKDFDISAIIGRLEYKYKVFIEFHSYTAEELESNYIFHNEVVNKGIFFGPA